MNKSSRVALCRSRKYHESMPWRFAQIFPCTDSDTPRNHTIGLQRISEALIASLNSTHEKQHDEDEKDDADDTSSNQNYSLSAETDG